jgi:hypothetical protein
VPHFGRENRADGCRSVAVKDSAVRDFNEFAKENLKRFVWSKGCHAWYSKKTDGEDNIVTAMYPGSLLHFKGTFFLLCQNIADMI